MLAHLQVKATRSLAMASQAIGRGLRKAPVLRAVQVAYFNRVELWMVRLECAISEIVEEQRIRDWLDQNASGWWDISHMRVSFEDETDAKMFFLAFA